MMRQVFLAEENRCNSLNGMKSGGSDDALLSCICGCYFVYFFCLCGNGMDNFLNDIKSSFP